MPDQTTIDKLANSWAALASAVAALFSAATAVGMWYFVWRDRVRNETPVMSVVHVKDEPESEIHATNLSAYGDIGFAVTNHSAVPASVLLHLEVSIISKDTVIKRIHGQGVFGRTAMSTFSPFESRNMYFRWEMQSELPWADFRQHLAEPEAQLHVWLEWQAFNTVRKKRKNHIQRLFMAWTEDSDGLVAVAHEPFESNADRARRVWTQFKNKVRAQFSQRDTRENSRA